MNKLTEKIIHDAEAEAAEIREQCRLKLEEMRAGFEDNRAAAVEINENDTRVLYQKELDRHNLRFLLEERKEILEYKIRCIEEIFDAAADRILCSVDLFQAIAEKAAGIGIIDGTEHLHYSSEQEHFFTDELSGSLNSIASEITGTPVSIPLHADPDIRDGGIIIRGERREINVTRHAIVQELRERCMKDVAEILFPEEVPSP